MTPGLDEAADPTTPAERLRELHRHPAWNALVLRNPSLPFDLLTAALHRADSTTPWYNPAVPLLLLASPHPDHLGAGHRMLRQEEKSIGMCSPHRDFGRKLAWWARRGSDERGAAVRLFARHLARLFGFPWVEAQAA